MTNGQNVPPDHPASQSDDGSYRGEEHSMLDGPDSAGNPHHLDHADPRHSDPRTAKETLMDPEAVTPTGNLTTADHSHVYHNMMRIGFGVGLPVGCAIAMFVALLLMSVNGLVAFFLSFLTWLAVYGFAKTFFVDHGHSSPGH